MGAGEDTVFSQSGRKPFQFLFAWQMKRKPFEVSAVSPGAVTALLGQRNVPAPNDIRKPVYSFVGIPSAVLMHEQLFMY